MNAVSDESSSALLESTYVVSDEVPAHTITRSLQTLLPTRHHPIGRQRFTLLDTFDGRVGRAGARLTHSVVDGHSIMMYPIPKAWTTDGFSADLNRELSPTDQTFIQSAYPW